VHASHSYPDEPCLRPCGLLGPSATVATLFILSRGYTEQQEWVWSLSSTLGREVWVGFGTDEMRWEGGKDKEAGAAGVDRLGLYFKAEAWVL
jgi:hypothetical protein